MARFFIGVCIMFVLSGCSYFSFFGDDANDQTISVSKPLIDVEFVASGRINDLARLKEGGRLLLKPFSAGPNVEVTDELDTLSLRLMRGILDVYEQKWPPDSSKDRFSVSKFDVAIAEEEEEAELMLYGRITEIYTSSDWKKWVLMKPKISLQVEGWLADTKNKSTVLSFSDEIEVEGGVVNHRDIALEIGRNVGQFIFKKR